jgi:hypothetical protein
MAIIKHHRARTRLCALHRFDDAANDMITAISAGALWVKSRHALMQIPFPLCPQ